MLWQLKSSTYVQGWPYLGMELVDSFVLSGLYSFTTDTPSMQVDVDFMELLGDKTAIGVSLAVL